MFTIDLENKKILFHSEFTKQELEKVMDMLNISDGEEWKIDFYQPYTPPTPQQPITYPQWGGTGTGTYPTWTTGDNTGLYVTNTSGTSTMDMDHIYNLTNN